MYKLVLVVAIVPAALAAVLCVLFGLGKCVNFQALV